MARELLIFRHGKAVTASKLDDFLRPITDKGKRGAQRMGAWLWQKDIRPDYIVSSPAERALVSAQKLCKASGQDSAAIVTDKRLYKASIKSHLDVLADCPKKKQRVLLVGHNPGLTELLLYLLGGNVPTPDDGKLLPAATLARLVMPGNWKKLGFDCAQLKSLTRPDDLPKKFPFPAPKGKEKRNRPAYYYDQSAVIPYRLQKHKIQVMLVRSSKRNHWVVPKGIHEPGMSAQKSAALEAFEEAGIRGAVSKSRLGVYEYSKWGATCKVQVYAMRVKEIIPENDWEEAHRGRKWLSAEVAADMVKEPALRPMILSLAGFIKRDN
ncbi:MAG: NUDIX domain-containing protein [Gammaproteobacteria bacterium]|nr:NUDIX domain-containing protein [Gammaproteobacteria bacterium]NNJ96943.1 NUDIX domain-containing protein [Gammaproteobacteria bacterium]